jgi:hypothetical protein
LVKILGSSCCRNFLSPFGGRSELDADMNLHDDNWKPRSKH